MIESSVGNTAFLDQGMAQLLTEEDVAGTMGMIFAELKHLRDSISLEDWKEFATGEFRRHPILKLLHQDPFGRRVFTKPRGYAGDAMMLDFLYGVEDGDVLPAFEESSALGKQICHYMVRTETSEAVRVRRGFIVEKLNELADTKAQPHVLSLACGHLREARHCSALRERRFGRYVGVDHDKESLAVVQREVGTFGVETVHASVREFLQGKVTFADFDLVYATGLYDYLPLHAAQRLTEILLRMLNPGGRLLLANVLPGIRAAAYLEACLDWWLIYRTKSEFMQVVETLPDEQIENYTLFVEEQKNMVFLEVARKG